MAAEPKPRFRLSRLAQADLAQIFAISTQRWGLAARRRYAAAIAGAMHRVAAEPQGPQTRDRSDLLPNLRSFHIRNARAAVREAGVRRPAHVIFYRTTEPGLVEIVRILHERMEPGRHLHGIGGDES